MNYLAMVLLLLIMTGCSDGSISKLTSYGESRSIKCYSAEKLIYSGVSTGKIQSETSSDGYYFREKESGRLMEVSGNCVIGGK
jgi:hypothetical protein